MKKAAVTIIAMIVIAFAVYIYRERRAVQSLGKASLPKPPKIRIVYSRKIKDKDRIKINSSFSAYEALNKVWSSQIQAREEFIVLYLDRSTKILGYDVISKGGVSGTYVDVKLIAATALKALASGVIIAHNHPSGNLNPSHADKDITRQIQEALKPLKISLLDHIILTKDNFYSFADEGLL